MMEHAETFIEMAESTEACHRNYLAEFDEKVWPIFQHYGYSKDTALVAWSLCKLDNKLDAIREAVDERF